MSLLRLKFLLAVPGIAVFSGNALAASAADAVLPSDAEIRAILVERIDAERLSPGIVVGVIDPKGRRIVSYGTFDYGDLRHVAGDTIFEIGTATKVFTALLLADMVQHHEVALTDPVAKYLPATVKVPERGRPITLQDLATHMSGLPPEPGNLASAMKDLNDPYAEYTAKELYDFLSSYRLERNVGSEWEYSNLGYALLGHALSLRAGMSYEELVRTRIAKPLGMQSTLITLSREMEKRFAIGHGNDQKPTANWNFKVLAGFGALRSTADDLLIFLDTALGLSKSPLTPVMAAMLKVRVPTTTPGLENALGWQITTYGGKEIVQKDGATQGYECFMAYDPKARAGVVVLANAYTTTGISDIGMHLLDPSVPLRGTKQTPVNIDTKLFDRYVGRYQLNHNRVLTVSRQENRFFADLTGMPKFEIFPQSDSNFFYKVYDAQIHFDADSQGRGKTVTLFYRGNRQNGERIEGPPPQQK